MNRYFGLLLVLVLCLFSCNQGDGYKKTKSGLRYCFHEINKENPKPNVGDVLKVEIAVSANDSVLYKSSEQMDNLMIVYRDHNDFGKLHECFSMMHKGDSVSFMLPADSVVKYLNMSELPDFINRDGLMKMSIKLIDFNTKEVLEQELSKLRQSYIDNSQSIVNDYIKANNIEEKPLESGLYYIEHKQGKGEYLRLGDKARIHYVAKLLNDKVIDDCSDTIVDFIIGKRQIFIGMEEGLLRMKKGGKSTLIVPYYLAFGEEGSSLVPPYMPLCIELELVDIVRKDVMEKQSIASSKKEFDKYISENNLNDNIVVDGLSYRIIQEGNGVRPTNNSKVKVHYIGKLIDGTVFDSSYDRNQPFEFVLGKGGVLPGWDLAVSMMSLGEVSEFVMSQELVYKDYSLGVIKPYSNLIYQIELIEIK